MKPLPIDPLLPQVAAGLREASALVLEAEPGAGKTTRVPWYLGEHSGYSGQVVVTEPRRLAARSAAERVAGERCLKVGSEVGYTVRFEDVTSRATRVRYVTEGVLLRRLLADPELSGVSAVVLDEFHERHMETDLLLMLLKRLRDATRPELDLVVMSATLDSEPIVNFLGRAKHLASKGRSFPVAVEHQARADDRPQEKQVSSAVRRLCREQTGDILVFLPGAREIRRAMVALEPLAHEHDLLVLPLHGDLPIAEQVSATQKATRRKVVLSTNVAESSVTVDGVVAVVDSGLARIAGHSAWTGMRTLHTHKASRASAIQRAGRAGRTQPGRVLRLYTQGDFESRPEALDPEVLRSDLAETVLLLKSIELPSAGTPQWLTPPPPAHIEAAESLLRLLGALDEAGELSPTGRRLLEFPVHPRLGRILVEGERRGVFEDASLIAVLLSERDIKGKKGLSLARHGAAPCASGPSDVLERVDLFREAESGGFRASRMATLGLDAAAVKRVARAYNQLRRLGKPDVATPHTPDEVEQALLVCILTGFADRLARRKTANTRQLVLANGSVARLSEGSVVHRPTLMVVVDVDEQPGRSAAARLASAVDEQTLYDLFPESISMDDELVWNANKERVEQHSSIRFGAVVLEEVREAAKPGAGCAELLMQKARERPERFLRGDAMQRWAARFALLRTHDSTLPDPDVLLERVLQAAAEEAASFDDLEANDLRLMASRMIPPSVRERLQQLAPERVTLSGGRSLEVHYEVGKPPWVESRLQDFFGSKVGPTVLGGRLPLLLHLLAPNRRALQVTTDLEGFWQRHYPDLRRQLMRRYPRHDWPLDPVTRAPRAARR